MPRGCLADLCSHDVEKIFVPVFLWRCLGQCHQDGEPLVLCPSAKSSLPATPRRAAASAFILHGSITGASTKLTQRVDLDPIWLRRWWWSCAWREGREKEGGEEEASALRRPFGRPSPGPSGPLWHSSLSGALASPFGRPSLAQSCGKERAPLHDHARGRGRLTTCESRHFKRVVLIVIFVVCALSPCPLNPEERQKKT